MKKAVEDELCAQMPRVRQLLRVAHDVPADHGRFKVFHLMSTGSWAYFEGNEIVAFDGRQCQETDLTVKALLRQEHGRWLCVALAAVLWLATPGAMAAVPDAQAALLAAIEARDLDGAPVALARQYTMT